MTQGTIIPPEVDADAIEYGHVYANYVKSVADTPGDPDADPDIVHVNGQVTFDSTFPGSSARGSIRLPGEPRSYGLIVTGDTFEIVNSKLVDHEGREGVRLIAAVDGLPVSWQAVVTLQDSAGRTIYNKSYIVHYDLWSTEGGGLEINLPDLIPTPSRLEPPEGAAVRAAEKVLEEIQALTGSNEQINLDIEGLKSEVIALHGETGQRLTAAEAAKTAAETARDAAVAARNAAQAARGEAQTARTDAQDASTQAGTSRDEALAYRNTALEHRSDALAYRNTALEHRNDANTSKLAAGESETNAKQSETNAAEHERRAGVERDFAEQISTDVFARAIQMDQDLGQFMTDWGLQFNQDLAQLQSLKSDMQGIADSVSASTSDAADSAGRAASDADRAEAARSGAVDARGQAEGHASVAQGHAEDAGVSATSAANDREQTGLDRTAANQSAGDAHASATAASQSAGSAEDDRVLAEDAASRAEGHAEDAGADAQRAEDAAAVAESQRWTIRGDWSAGSYDAGDVVVYEERAYYAETATSVEPPAQPWIPLTPAGGGGASHWDDLDGKPSVFPPTEHGHDAGDITGEATPLLDVGDAMATGSMEGMGSDALTLSEWMSMLIALQVNVYQPGFYLDVELSGKSDVGHGHTISDTDGLQAALDGKADESHDHDDRYVGLSGDDTKTGDLLMDGGSINYRRPSTSAGWARGFNWKDTDGTTMGGFGAHGGGGTLNRLYIGHGSSPWSGPELDVVPGGVTVRGDLNVSGDTNLTKAQVGLGNVDNTADADKPVSTATQQALNSKSDDGHTHTIDEVDGLRGELNAAAESGTEVEVMTRSAFDQITPDPGTVYIVTEG